VTVPGTSPIRLATADDLPRLRPLWDALYRQQQAQGMLLPVPPGAFEEWARSFAPVMGRFACVAIAERDGAVTGFVAGRIRTIPPFFGGGLAGFVSDVFVDESQRGHGLARKLLDLATEWFAARDVRRLELQVIVGNPGARGAYLRLGWKEELVQMVLDLPGRGNGEAGA
jgi:GNAT superfamily N-acetyltransferase